MSNEIVLEQIEVVLRKINWAQEILNSAQETSEDTRIVDILSGISFIINSASNDIEKLYRSIR
ncbi:hypothetical protein [Orbus mooreae]|uniref:hypothetical protein n=1 Tax=Orbus mooreae TaxID=3074107 RepID=UPI00370D1621